MKGFGAASDRVDGAGRATRRGAPTELRVLSSIAEIAEPAWNALLDEDATPFLKWAFLEALEHAGCVSPRAGWTPRHLALFRGADLIAAAPAYLCQSSDGDFSQDWGFAEGASRAGIRYYPKLAVTVPFTPATGRRFLVAPGPSEDRDACVRALVEGAIRVAEEEGCSGVQVLFALPDESALLEALGLTPRVSFQYHWHNRDYRSPDEFLSRFDSKRRNQLKRERAAPAKQGISIRTVRGDELSADPRGWARAMHDLHRATVDKLVWGRAWLNQSFYERVIAGLASNLEIVEARRDGERIAGAFNVASPSRLYGRYWGCHEEHPFLHFNVCLHHSIDECIRRGVRVFEGGAGGEHKLARGFEPTETRSAFLYFDPRLDEAVRKHLARENRVLADSLRRFRDGAPVLKKPAVRP